MENQLATAVTNLLANAVAYSLEHTRIAVGARARAGFVEITVTDSGIGIPREDRSRVFERFYRVDRARSRETGGTGLGLAIASELIELNGGRLSLDDTAAGTCFRITIPDAAGA